MEFKETKSYYIFENNNRYSKKHFTFDEAYIAVSTLTNCKDCTDCLLCKDCTSCTKCYESKDLDKCVNCKNCKDCSDCKICESCTSCDDCIECQNADLCMSCAGVKNTIKNVDGEQEKKYYRAQVRNTKELKREWAETERENARMDRQSEYDMLKEMRKDARRHE